MENEEYQEAIKYFDSSIKRRPYYPEPYFLRALAKEHLQDLHGALLDYNILVDLNPELSWFDGVVVSGEEKLKKPDPRLYRVLCDRYSVNPAQAIFVDDSYPNIIAARELGFKVIHFQNPEQLESDLRYSSKD